jgi:hypothetical protein
MQTTISIATDHHIQHRKVLVKIASGRERSNIPQQRATRPFSANVA